MLCQEPGTLKFWGSVLGCPHDYTPLPCLQTQLFSIMKLTFLSLSNNLITSWSFQTEKEKGREIYWSLKNQQRLGKDLFSVAMVHKWDQFRQIIFNNRSQGYFKGFFFFKQEQKGTEIGGGFEPALAVTLLFLPNLYQLHLCLLHIRFGFH